MRKMQIFGLILIFSNAAYAIPGITGPTQIESCEKLIDIQIPNMDPTVRTDIIKKCKSESWPLIVGSIPKQALPAERVHTAELQVDDSGADSAGR